MIAIQALSVLPTCDDSSRLLGYGICLDILERVFSNHHRRILVEQDALLRCAVEDLPNFEEADLISKSTSRTRPKYRSHKWNISGMLWFVSHGNAVTTLHDIKQSTPFEIISPTTPNQ